jgi:hypothetical protein
LSDDFLQELDERILYVLLRLRQHFILRQVAFGVLINRSRVILLFPIVLPALGLVAAPSCAALGRALQFATGLPAAALLGERSERVIFIFRRGVIVLSLLSLLVPAFRLLGLCRLGCHSWSGCIWIEAAGY